MKSSGAPHPLRQVPSKAWESPSAAEGSMPRTLCLLQPFILEKRSQRPQPRFQQPVSCPESCESTSLPPDPLPASVLTGSASEGMKFSRTMEVSWYVMGVLSLRQEAPSDPPEILPVSVSLLGRLRSVPRLSDGVSAMVHVPSYQRKVAQQPLTFSLGGISQQAISF